MKFIATIMIICFVSPYRSPPVTEKYVLAINYSLFAFSLPTEVITIFIDDVLLRYFDIFQIFVCVGMAAQLVGNHVVANCSLLLIVVFWPP